MVASVQLVGVSLQVDAKGLHLFNLVCMHFSATCGECGLTNHSVDKTAFVSIDVPSSRRPRGATSSKVMTSIYRVLHLKLALKLTSELQTRVTLPLL